MKRAAARLLPLFIFFVLFAPARGYTEDADLNGVEDSTEQQEADNFCPCVVMDQRDYAVGVLRTISMSPEPVEIMTNHIWAQVYNLEGQIAGSDGTATFDPNSDYSSYDKTTQPMTCCFHTQCGVVDFGTWKRHFDFGGAGPNCDNPRVSGGTNDQPAGWQRVYADGNQYSSSGVNFPHTVYAHIYGTPVSGHHIIQYWFFYPYDDWVADHEGDWEHVDVHVDLTDPAHQHIEKAVYYFHERYKVCETAQTEVGDPQHDAFDFYVVDHTHPVVFVGGYSNKTMSLTPTENPTTGGGPASHGCYPVLGRWDNVVHKEYVSVPFFDLSDDVGGKGLYIPWNRIVDNDSDDRYGVVLIRRPSYYNFNSQAQAHMSWLQANIWWGHPRVKSFGSDSEVTWLVQGNEAPSGPFYQETWEHSGVDVGRFTSYTGMPNQFTVASDAHWTPPSDLQLVTPGEPLHGVADIVARINFADDITIEYGAGPSPTQWSTRGVTSVYHFPLGEHIIGNWNTGVVPQGTYTIRVRAYQGAQVYTATETVSVTHRSALVASTGGNFTSIQDAIDWAEMGDTVKVATARYESILMKPTLQLLAAPHASPELFGDNGVPAIEIWDESQPCTIDGFTISHNYPDPTVPGGPAENGVKIVNSSPIFKNCAFVQNSATRGGGVRVIADTARLNGNGGVPSAPVFEDCFFESNYSEQEGGGVFLDGASGTFTRCQFISNYTATGDGSAAVKISGPVPTLAVSPTFTDCVFKSNRSPYASASTIRIADVDDVFFEGCLFTGNNTAFLGRLTEAKPRFTNCTIAGNDVATTMFARTDVNSVLTCTRCIISSNDGPIVPTEFVPHTLVEQSLLYGNTSRSAGPNDDQWSAVVANPAFCNAASGDYHLYAFSPAAPDPNDEYGSGLPFTERVGAYDVGCVPNATAVTVVPGSNIHKPDSFLLTCPKGEEGMDHLIITTTFSKAVVTRPLGASEISLQPPYLTAGLISSSTIRGTTAASTDESYSVTLDHPYLSGFGEDQEIALYLDGHALQQHAIVNHRSPDMKSAGAPGPATCGGDLSCPDGKVTNADFSWFVGHYPTGANPNAPYSKTADYQDPMGAPIGLADFSQFAVHFSGSGHKYEGAPENLMQVMGNEEIASTHVVLGFTEEYVTALDHRLYVDVTLADCANMRWCLFALKANRSDLTLSSWQPSAWAASSAPFSTVETENGQELYFGVIMINDMEESTRQLGRLTFDVSGTDPVTIANDQFLLTVGELEIGESQNGAALLAGNGQPVFAHMSGVSGRALSSAIQQVFHNRLEQNFPNPFNPQTTLAYSLHDAGNVTLSIYDVAGRRIRELVNEHRQPGAYKVVWDGTDAQGSKVASGIYFYKLSAGSFTETKKMVMLK